MYCWSGQLQHIIFLERSNNNKKNLCPHRLFWNCLFRLNYYLADIIIIFSSNCSSQLDDTTQQCDARNFRGWRSARVAYHVLIGDGQQVALLVAQLQALLCHRLHGGCHVVVALRLLRQLGLLHQVVLIHVSGCCTTAENREGGGGGGDKRERMGGGGGKRQVCVLELATQLMRRARSTLEATEKRESERTIKSAGSEGRRCKNLRGSSSRMGMEGQPSCLATKIKKAPGDWQWDTIICNSTM